MRRLLLVCAYVCLLSCLLREVSSVGVSSTYRAGAVQFTPSGGWNVPPIQAVQQSVDRFEPFVQQAHKQGVQVIVFPEGGTGMFEAESENTRGAMLPYCVSIPDVSESPNPCQQFGDHPPTSTSPFYQTWRVSCLAKEYNMIIAMNLCETRNCTRATDPTCPEDGRFQWNTEVVFDEAGTVVLKYHKAHLFGGSAVFDQAPSVPSSFLSSFGVRFGAFICYDILYKHPAGDLVQQGITDFIYSSFWVNQVPSIDAVMQQQGWSRMAGVNLIASNVGTADAYSGGGIYAAGEPLAVLFGADGWDVNELLVADLPIRTKEDVAPPAEPTRTQPDPHHRTRRDHAHAVETMSVAAGRRYDVASSLVYAPCQPNVMFAGIANCTIFSAKSLLQAAADIDPLSDITFRVPITHHGISCMIEVEFDAASSSAETYVAFAYEGVQNFTNTPSPLSLQVCALHHCVPGDTTPLACDGEWQQYDVRVNSFAITGTGFTSTAMVFPLLAIDDGQIVDIADTQATDTNDNANAKQDAPRVVQWTTTDRFRNQSLSSTLLYGVRPDL